MFVLCMRKEVQIVNKLGLHARPAAIFVRWVTRLKSTVTIWKGEENFSAASLLEVDRQFGLRRPCCPRGIVPDEKEAIDELEALLLRFREEEGGSA